MARDRKKAKKAKKAGKARTRKAEGQYVVLRLPNPLKPGMSVRFEAFGTRGAALKALRGLVINSETKIALLKLESVTTYLPSVRRLSKKASFLETEKAAHQ